VMVGLGLSRRARPVSDVCCRICQSGVLVAAIATLSTSTPAPAA
jgi:hypothetical protein